MYYLKSTSPLILAATLASAGAYTDAYTAPASAIDTACATNPIVKQCVDSTQSRLDHCASNDLACRCNSSIDMVQCYKDCPEDPSQKDAESLRQQNCKNVQTSALPPALTSAMRSASSAVPSTAAAATTSGVSNMGSTDGDSIYLSGHDAQDDDKGHPTKSYSGLEANNPKEGAASSIRAWTWINLLGLGLAVF